MKNVINRAKELLDRGEVTYGSLSLIPEPAMAEIVGGAGFDFFIIDTEHVAIDGSGVASMVRACQAAGVGPLVRVRQAEEKTLLWTLDAGAQGVVVPLIEDAPTAQRAVDLCRFPPDGRRTLCSASRAAAHGLHRPDLDIYLQHSNANTLVVGLIETPAGLSNIEEIAATEIDVLMVGRADLSLAMGLGYAPGHPAVVQASEEALKATISSGTAAGILAYSVEEARKWVDFGCRFVVYSQPEMILADHYRSALDQLRPRQARSVRG